MRAYIYAIYMCLLSKKKRFRFNSVIHISKAQVCNQYLRMTLHINKQIDYTRHLNSIFIGLYRLKKHKK
jgi:hypothetical protein